MKVTNEMVNDFCLAIIESEDELSGAVGDSVRNDVRKGLQAVFNAMPKQEPVGYVYTHRLKELNDVDKDCVFFKYAGSRDSKWFTPLYTHPQPQPQQEPLSNDVLRILWGRNTVRGCTNNEFAMLARVVEKAHGIGV